MSEVFMIDELKGSARERAIEAVKSYYHDVFDDDTALDAPSRYEYLFEEAINNIKNTLGFDVDIENFQYDIGFRQGDFCFVNIGSPRVEDGMPNDDEVQKFPIKFLSNLTSKYKSGLAELAKEFELNKNDTDRFISLALSELKSVNIVQSNVSANYRNPQIVIEPEIYSVADYTRYIAEELTKTSSDVENAFISEESNPEYPNEVSDYEEKVYTLIDGIFSSKIENCLENICSELYGALRDALLDENSDDYIIEFANNNEVTFDEDGNILDANTNLYDY